MKWVPFYCSFFTTINTRRLNMRKMKWHLGLSGLLFLWFLVTCVVVFQTFEGTYSEIIVFGFIGFLIIYCVVTVVFVAPGPIWTPLQLDQGQLKKDLPEFGQDARLGRAGQPAELAHVYVLLASQEASYITGQIYGVTGGETIN